MCSELIEGLRISQALFAFVRDNIGKFLYFWVTIGLNY